MKRIPTWLAISEITTTGFVLLTLILTLIYAQFWILKGPSKKHQRPAERSIKLWPLIAVLSLLTIIVICMLSNRDVAIDRFGNLTPWSFSLFLATLIFPVASLASVIVLWRVPKGKIRRAVLIYSIITTLALAITTTNLSYWGIIGLRTWA